jgi:hypothetical protein
VVGSLKVWHASRRRRLISCRLTDNKGHQILALIFLLVCHIFSLKRIGHSSTPKSKPTSSNGGRRYANYSETDDDEEDDDEEGGGDEDLDSDLADFIDDSMVDDLQREDLEETLR